MEENSSFTTMFGDKIPPLHMDIISKKIFAPDEQPDRLEYLLRSLAKDDTIVVKSSASNEGFHKCLFSKKTITDIPAWLKDGRLSNLEVQRIAQNYIIPRGEVYTSNMILVQYSVYDQKKTELSYLDIKSSLDVILMVNSPRVFKEEFDTQTNCYIHRFSDMQSDTGVKHKSKATTIYVELDKCLQQLRLHQNAENPNNTPDELQIMLAMIANINDDIVKEYMAEYPTLKKIYEEIVVFSQDKEVQGMIIEEMLRENDYYSGINEAKAEARDELIKELLADGKITPDEAKHYAPVPSEKNK